MKTSPAPDGFDQAFPTIYRSAFSAARRILRDDHAADDVAVEACYRAAKNWAQVSGYAGPWTVRVASNLAIDAARRSARRSRFREPARTSPAPSSDRVDLVAALRRLPKRQREVVTLRYLGDLSEIETAQALGIAPGTVKIHAHRGLAALRSYLGCIVLEAAS
jgi:RNA polymerase sigma-70 factor (ECF subfamily)